jgi:hypothetical protein
VSVRYIPYKNSLGRLIRAAGGKAFEDAVTDADTNLGELQAANLAGVDAALRQVVSVAAAAPSPASAEQLYSASNELVALGGVCGLDDLSQAAYSLCDLIDQAQPALPQPQAVQVHVDALRLLRHGPLVPEGERRQVLQGLSDVVRRTTRLRA